MQHIRIAFGVLAALPPAVNCIAFGGPAPTATSPGRALVDWTPKPTKGPSVAELRKRQSFDAETCGWIDGDLSSALTCMSGGACKLYTAGSFGMAGCCDGSDTQNCGWVNTCLDYDSYTARCDSECELNTFVRKCSNVASPYCVTWTYPSDGVADYGCASYSSAMETVLPYGGDLSDSSLSGVSLQTLSGDAVTGWGESSSAESSDILATVTDSEVADTATESDVSSSYTTTIPSAGGPSRKKDKKKVSVAMIVGIVIGALVLLFVLGAAIIFFCVKKKKERQLAANQQTIAAAQANRPQSQYPPQMEQQPLMHQPPVPNMQQPLAPAPQHDGYFAPAVATDPHKINPQTQVNGYQAQSPISNPPTPAPPYVQPYYAAPNAPPMPTQTPVQYPARQPTPGTYEVDAMSVPHTPASHGQTAHTEQLYELAPGK
ncbi:hypothetical protein BDV95DRAFT_602587 [Massariosphaeria phaeospora]|uniref:Mid2 domain-containing protein n=1 Tax=Massariosphaeria phaeospora TaxID=100035 RepID=A0A7C8IHP3_9PLEO|nr:hypothetical protein BDV95DRAFT_602587 [Massariosphaeria phaeospora]